MALDQITNTLKQMSEILHQNEHFAQASYVDKTVELSASDPIAFAASLCSGAMWGSSGAVWEVGVFRSAHEQQSFWQMLIDLAESMRLAGIQSLGAESTAEILKRRVKT